MCTCPSPDRNSVRASTHALVVALVATLRATSILLLALLTAPARRLPFTGSAASRPAPIGHVDVQVHLENRQCIAEVRQTIRRTLQRAAHTWAPLPLPVDRIVVAAGFPPEGRADIYDEFFRLAGQDKRSGSRASRCAWSSFR